MFSPLPLLCYPEGIVIIPSLSYQEHHMYIQGHIGMLQLSKMR
jgi:hypothetical protein